MSDNHRQSAHFEVPLGDAVGSTLYNGQRTGYFACVALTSVMIAGCSFAPEAQLNTPPPSYQTRHPIVVDNSPTNLDLPAGNKRTKLSRGAKSAIGGFATEYRRSGATSIEILTPSGSSNVAAASNLAGQARTQLQRSGIPGAQIRTRTYKAPSTDQPGNIRLTFTGLKARVASECGLWPTDIGAVGGNGNYENFGCATQSNLAAIIADPNDLIAPRGQGEINPERTDVVINDFEANSSTAVESATVPQSTTDDF